MHWVMTVLQDYELRSQKALANSSSPGRAHVKGGIQRKDKEIQVKSKKVESFKRSLDLCLQGICVKLLKIGEI